MADWSNNKPEDMGKGGVKFDQGKARHDLVPPYPIAVLADILTYGAAKYDDRNWEQGMPHGRLYAAMMRHLLAYWGGEDIDPESGRPHLGHALCCLVMLVEMTRTHPELDTRPK